MSVCWRLRTLLRFWPAKGLKLRSWPQPTEYLIQPELPIQAVVCLTGDSESGKTTLARTWARYVLRRGHAVLILDRDKNPRDRICERLARLGIESDGGLFHVWDCQ